MTDWPETSESLILRVKDPQDEASWRELVAVYRPVVFRMARSRGLQHEDAEDLAQGVFVSVARAIDQWQPVDEGPRFRNWLARITRNAIINALTRLRPDRAAGSSSVADVLNSIPTDGTDGDELIPALLKESRLEAIRWAANELQAEFTETTWAIFRATVIEGRPAAEVASVSGRSIGAVYAARCRVAARIKEMVETLSDLWSET
jgi:RNA polymerase sigma-70 factor (ECF subfamily)